MSTGRVQIRDVLELRRKPVDPSPDENYITIGVRSFGRGIFHYDPRLGTEIGKLRFFEVQPQQLVISNIKAWEGAVAVSSSEDEGHLASNRFLLYSPIDDTRIDVRWARWFFLSEPGNALLQRASPGSADRNRTLGKERFESLWIPLPPRVEQQRVADRLDAIRDAVRAVEESQLKADRLGKAAVESAIWDVFRRGMTVWPTRSLGEVAEVNPPRDRLSMGEQVGWVPMAALDDMSGTISPGQRDVGEVSKGYRQFRRGDVVFARITPSMQNGKCAIYTGPANHAYGSTEFHVLRPRDSLQARWIHRFLRTREIRGRAAEHLTGTAGQQRVPADFLEGISIPIPPESDQLEALGKIDRIAEMSATLRDRRTNANAVRIAIEPAALNQVFSSID